jgi:Domain of unknown function (DUF1929)
MAHEGIHAWEVQTLGSEHADEHAALRRAERRAARHWAALSPAQRAAGRRRYRAAERRATEASANFPKPPSKVGSWTTAPFSLPNYAIHSALLPTGKVLFWGYPFRQPGQASVNQGRAAVWDPSKGTGPDAFDEVNPPKIDLNGDGDLVPAPIWCAGESHLPNGDILVTGGNLVSQGRSYRGQIYTDYAGLLNVFTFDPWSESWREQPSMEQGRWYPTQIELANGSTLISGGFDEQWPGGLFNQTLDVFSPPASRLGQGKLVSRGQQPYSQTTYPRLEMLPNGEVLMTGPTPLDTALYDPRTAGWSDIPNFSDARNGESAVLEPGGPAGSWRVTMIGGYGWLDTDRGAWKTTETINASSRHPTWKPGPELNVQRSWENTVLLPDGSKVAVGGGAGFTDEDGNYTTSPHHFQRQVDVFDPTRDRWHLGPPQVEDRTYHSTALLLPDGRIWSAGDDGHPLEANGYASPSDTGEIYSPPYLFKGPRPSITAAPDALSYGEDAAVRTSRSPKAKTAVLMAPGAATHALDTSQRYVKLRVRGETAHGLRIKAPARPEVAPPGYYMLFVLSGDGVPSEARWVKLGNA